MNKIRMTVTGDVEIQKLEEYLKSSFPNVQIKFWAKKGKTGKRVTKTQPISEQ